MPLGTLRRTLALSLTVSLLSTGMLAVGAQAGPRADAAAPVRAVVGDPTTITTVSSPAYRATITDATIPIEFDNAQGTSAKVYSQKQPDDLSASSMGTKELIGDVQLVDGHGSVQFPASEFPKGPISVRIQVFAGDVELDNAYLQLDNQAGVEWRPGLANAPVNPVTAGMDEVFTDDFTAMPSISVSGIGTTYASRKVDEERGGMFGHAAFEDAGGPYDPFSIADDEYMKLTTTYHPDGDYRRSDYWNQPISSGYLSSMDQAGGGFHTEGGRNQYFEARMFFGPNPGMWPAFWTLTANGYAQNPDLANQPSDELDILEGYMGTPQTYQIAWHPWAYDKPPAAGYDASELGGGTKVDLNKEVFGNIDLAMGFHTVATYITEQWTYYYADGVQVAKHKTLPFSWQYGNYFILNAAVSEHFGVDGSAPDPYANFGVAGGFTRYGNESDTYVDWVRVYEDPAEATRFEADATVTAAPGATAAIEVRRNEQARALSGTYRIEAPAGWKLRAGGTDTAIGEGLDVPFAAASATDTLTFVVPEDDPGTGQVVITPQADGASYTAVTVAVSAPDPNGELVRVDGTTYKYRSTGGAASGGWSSLDP